MKCSMTCLKNKKVIRIKMTYKLMRNRLLYDNYRYCNLENYIFDFIFDMVKARVGV